MSLNEVRVQDIKQTTASAVKTTALSILIALSFCHLLNDLVQSLLPSIYPILKKSFHLNFAQVGFITLTFQVTASVLQPLIGLYTDKRPMPYSLVIGMGFTMAGLTLAAFAPNYPLLLVAAVVIGMGSAVFHPESSRMARFASGGKHGLAQSLFQVGGNTGSSLGPLFAACAVASTGQRSLALFAPLALLGMAVLANVASWYTKHPAVVNPPADKPAAVFPNLSKKRVAFSVSILLALIFSKYVYLASLTSYYTFYLIHKFHISVQDAQIHLFVFLAAVAVGTFTGGPVGDRVGRKYVIWASILGILPLTLVLPYVGLMWTGILTVLIGFILASAFSAILVFAQELMPGRVGLISGLFFGFAFGVAGTGAGVLGVMADHLGITAVYKICSYLPAIGLLAALLPSVERKSSKC